MENTQERFMGIEIDRGIPIPEDARMRVGRASILRQLEVGDSIQFPADQAKKYNSSAQKMGIKIRVKTDTLMGTSRLWRIA